MPAGREYWLRVGPRLATCNLDVLVACATGGDIPEPFWDGWLRQLQNKDRKTRERFPAMDRCTSTQFRAATSIVN